MFFTRGKKKTTTKTQQKNKKQKKPQQCTFLHHAVQPIRIKISDFTECNKADVVGMPASTDATGLS